MPFLDIKNTENIGKKKYMNKLKPLISLIIIICLPFLFFIINDDEITEKPEEMVLTSISNYCNTRFDFCVLYPSGILPFQEVSPNDDGIILKTKNGQSEVNVHGSYNIMQWKPNDLFEFTVNSMTEDKDGAKILSTVFENDYYESFFIFENNNYFLRSFFVDDYYVSLVVKVPVDEPLLMEQLRKEVKVTYGGDGQIKS
jgi:hypothetical protein